MRATDMLRQDHARVAELLDAYEGARGLDAKRAIFRQVREELTVHATLEEQVFYPAVRALGGPEARPLLREAGETHGEIETLLADADDAQERGDEAALDALVGDVRDEVETHVEEEEDELLPLAEERLGEERLADLGRRMLSMRPAVPA